MNYLNKISPKTKEEARDFLGPLRYGKPVSMSSISFLLNFSRHDSNFLHELKCDDDKNPKTKEVMKSAIDFIEHRTHFWQVCHEIVKYV